MDEPIAAQMNAQNIYDDPEFLAGYVTLERQVHGLDGAPEWPLVRSMVPDLAGCDVADLGCGFGWFTRWASEQGAASVLGIDVSTRMLERARSDTQASNVRYVLADLDTLELERASTDVVFSSLALHYVIDLRRLMAVIADALRPGGSLTFSVEHPIYSAPSSPAFETSQSGETIWPLNRYHLEGERVTNWFVDGVIKQHRTVASWVNTVVGAGLVLDRIEEWGPTAADIEGRSELAADRDRPWFLVVAATKPQQA